MTEKVNANIRMRLQTTPETAAQKLKTSPIGGKDQELTKKLQSLEADKLKLQAKNLRMKAENLEVKAKNLKMKAKLAKYKGEREKPEPQVFYIIMFAFDS
jgi:septal ring factor EnvC (AmiA/AmiB activator)